MKKYLEDILIFHGLIKRKGDLKQEMEIVFFFHLMIILILQFINAYIESKKFFIVIIL